MNYRIKIKYLFYPKGVSIVPNQEQNLRRRIKKLEEENKALRNNLKVAYSDYYKNV